MKTVGTIGRRPNIKEELPHDQLNDGYPDCEEDRANTDDDEDANDDEISISGDVDIVEC